MRAGTRTGTGTGTGTGAEGRTDDEPSTGTTDNDQDNDDISGNPLYHLEELIVAVLAPCKVRGWMGGRVGGW